MPDSRVLVGGLLFVLGVSSGVAFTVATDSTAFSQADLDRAGQTASPGSLDAGSDGLAQLEALQAEAATESPELRTALIRLAELENEILARDVEIADSAPTISRLRQEVRRLRTEAAVTRQSAQAASKAAARAEDVLAVAGTVRAVYELGADLQPWPTDCSDAVARYLVVVQQGDGTAVLEAPMEAASVVSRSERDDVLELTCALTWSAELPEPHADYYEFRAVAARNPERPLSAATAPVEALEAGVAPELTASR